MYWNKRTRTVAHMKSLAKIHWSEALLNLNWKGKLYSWIFGLNRVFTISFKEFVWPGRHLGVEERRILELQKWLSLPSTWFECLPSHILLSRKRSLLLTMNSLISQSMITWRVVRPRKSVSRKTSST